MWTWLMKLIDGHIERHSDYSNNHAAFSLYFSKERHSKKGNKKRKEESENPASPGQQLSKYVLLMR